MTIPTDDLATLSVTIEEQVLHVGYLPQQLDTKIYQELGVAAAAPSNAEQCAQTAEILAGLIATWSLLNDGQPIEPNRESLAHLPGRVLGALSTSFRIQWVTNEVKRIEARGGPGWRAATRALLAEAAKTGLFDGVAGKPAT